MTILLVPGFMLDGDLWRDLRPELEQFGSIVDVDTTRDASIEDMAARAIASVDGPLLPIGFSMGGYVAREIARRAADRVRGLVLIATSARGDSPGQAQRKAFHAKQLADSRFGGLKRSAIANSLHSTRAEDEELIDRIQAMSRRLGGEVFRGQSLLPRHGDLERLGDIRCPTLILAGDGDQVRSLAEARELHDNIQGSELSVIEGAGHMLPMEAPSRVSRIIASWVANLRAASA
ncbi:pimeloyl-ACP methyl ester carboxylesterase [Sinorhizobium fredii]|uniref:Alpha/beta hydrolase Fold protein n=1 Tax=Sinorhizobium fredii (strain USDA 257) TaxID=1185652 RepID=I3XBW7_SINF2|nr:alpha/beta hydrolase [Sinorhizobium fredii]AFL53373.1 alpha/beta hydrolase Fold protein [Sinorhizobium fredii USDA 257]